MKDKTAENESRLENIYEFIGVAKEFEEEEADNSLSDFLDSIALVADVDNLEEGTEAVTLMTMHNAKGLEYPVVFIVGLEEGLFPSKRSMDEDKGVEEERRLCYVAITRAKKELILTNARQRTMYGMTTTTIPSRFTEEIPEEFLDEAAKDNVELGRRKQDKYTDSEYAKVENWISNTFKSTGGDSDYSYGSSYGSSYSNSYSSSYGRKAGASVSGNVGIDAASFLKNMNTSSMVKNTGTAAEIKSGDKVKHKKFGIGIVKNINTEDDMTVAEISFERFGMKRLIVTGTTLEVIG